MSSEYPDPNKVLTISTASALLHDFGNENAHIDKERGPIRRRVNTPEGEKGVKTEVGWVRVDRSYISASATRESVE